MSNTKTIDNPFRIFVRGDNPAPADYKFLKSRKNNLDWFDGFWITRENHNKMKTIESYDVCEICPNYTEIQWSDVPDNIKKFLINDPDILVEKRMNKTKELYDEFKEQFITNKTTSGYKITEHIMFKVSCPNGITKSFSNKEEADEYVKQQQKDQFCDDLSAELSIPFSKVKTIVMRYEETLNKK